MTGHPCGSVHGQLYQAKLAGRGSRLEHEELEHCRGEHGGQRDVQARLNEWCGVTTVTDSVHDMYTCQCMCMHMHIFGRESAVRAARCSVDGAAAGAGGRLAGRATLRALRTPDTPVLSATGPRPQTQRPERGAGGPVRASANFSKFPSILRSRERWRALLDRRHTEIWAMRI